MPVGVISSIEGAAGRLSPTDGAGVASSATGLRRYRSEAGGTATPWEKNWLKNHPVQSTAASAFKLAGIRLDRLYPQYDARLIIPVHDAYVFEAPIDRLHQVAELTRRVMLEAVTELLPVLRPKAETNTD